MYTSLGDYYEFFMEMNHSWMEMIRILVSISIFSLGFEQFPDKNDNFSDKNEKFSDKNGKIDHFNAENSEFNSENRAFLHKKTIFAWKQSIFRLIMWDNPIECQN